MAGTQRLLHPSNSDLPSDILFEILTRLPVKSLLRFRCVSKSWLSLVDDDTNFARSHLKTFKNNRNETRLLIGTYQGGHIARCSDTFESLPETLPTTPDERYWPRTVCSIDGLILLKFGVDEIVTRLKVWNPSIRKLLKVPTFVGQKTPSHSSKVVHKDIGLGYDPIAKDYKILKLVFVEKTLDSVAIYSLGAGSWKAIEFQGNGSPTCSDWHWNIYGIAEAVYIQGSLYFTAEDVGGDRGWDLVRFDLSKEAFSSFKMPHYPSRNHIWWTLMSTDDGGSALRAYAHFTPEMYLWEGDGESMCWTKLKLNCSNKSRPLHVKKNGDVLLETYRDEGLSVLLDVESYSPKTQEHKTLQRRLNHGFSYVSCYVESLILHRSIRGVKCQKF